MERDDSLDSQRRVLLVELFYCDRSQMLVDHLLRSRHKNRNAAFLLRKNIQRNLVTIAIDKDNPLCRLANELLREGIGVIVPALEEYLLRREVAAGHSPENRVEPLLIASLVLFVAGSVGYLSLLYIVDTH